MYTEDKFDFQEYFLPLVDELNDLRENKITMSIEDDEYTFNPVITHCAVDLPAKSKVQETKQFGGYDACTYCEMPGELILIKKSKDPVKKSKNNQKTDKNEEEKLNKFFRYVEWSRSYPLREEQETLKKMLAASSSTQDVDGIKGKNTFARLCLVFFLKFYICRNIFLIIFLIVRLLYIYE